MRARTILVLLLALAAPSLAQDFYTGLPAPLERVGYEQNLGDSIDLSLEFRDRRGGPVELAEVTDGKPAVLALVYFNCPMLCSLSINGLVSSLRAVDLVPGEDFEVVVVSFDPEDTPELAASAHQRAIDRFDRPGTADGWHFLTGESASIDALTESVGFRYNRLEDSDEFAHSAGIVLLTPEGRISRYLYGVEYPPRDIRLGLIESTEEKIGTLVDELLLFCYQYDPATGTYSALTLGLVRIAGALTVLLILALVLLSLRRERRAPALGEPEHVA